MPKEKVIFRGINIDDIVKQLQEAGATAKEYKVELFDGEKQLGIATGPYYNDAFLSVMSQAGVLTDVLNHNLDVSKYRTEITVIAEKPYPGESRAAGAGPSERPRRQYTNLF